MVKFCLCTLDSITDILYCIYLLRRPERAGLRLHGWLALTFIVVPVTVSFATQVRLLVREFHDMAFARWFRRHTLGSVLVLFFSLGNPDVLRILGSGVLNLHLFSAPFRQQTKDHLHLAGLVNLVLEDIPQVSWSLLRSLCWTAAQLHPFSPFDWLL